MAPGPVRRARAGAWHAARLGHGRCVPPAGSRQPPPAQRNGRPDGTFNRNRFLPASLLLRRRAPGRPARCLARLVRADRRARLRSRAGRRVQHHRPRRPPARGGRPRSPARSPGHLARHRRRARAAGRAGPRIRPAADARRDGRPDRRRAPATPRRAGLVCRAPTRRRAHRSAHGRLRTDPRLCRHRPPRGGRGAGRLVARPLRDALGNRPGRLPGRRAAAPAGRMVACLAGLAPRRARRRALDRRHPRPCARGAGRLRGRRLRRRVQFAALVGPARALVARRARAAAPRRLADRLPRRLRRPAPRARPARPAARGDRARLPARAGDRPPRRSAPAGWCRWVSSAVSPPR